MSDPAADAALRTLIAIAGQKWERGGALTAAAREALGPIRAEVERIRELSDAAATQGEGLFVAIAADAVNAVLDRLEPLIYTTEWIEKRSDNGNP